MANSKRNTDKVVREVTSEVKSAVKKSAKKHPLVWLLIVLAILIVLFIITPVENPLETTLVFDSVSEELAIPAYSKDEIIVQHVGYTLSYNEEHEQPNWVAYLLTADEVFGNASSRDDNFREDPSVPTGSATLADYKGSGYDRGHLIPAADSKWSAKAMDECFYLSNMSPQNHAFNAGIWSKLEAAVRTMAAQNHEICVVTGPILTDGPYETIGENKVSVPNRFYKVILDYYGPEKKAIGYILSQEDKGDLRSFAVSVDEVEELSGIDFFPLLDDEEEAALESEFNVKLWDISDFSRTGIAKKYGYDLDGEGYTEEAVVVQAEPENLKDKVLFFLYTNLGGYKVKVIAFVEGLIKR